MVSPLRILTLLSFIALANYSVAQCDERNGAFKSGEEVKYAAYYNWNFIWMQAGEVTFTVTSDYYQAQPVYSLKAIGSTFKTYDYFYSVRDTFESIVDTLTIQPFYYRQSSNEGRFNSQQTYWFDKEKHRVNTSVKMEEEPVKVSEFGYSSCAMDVLSMVYKIRNADFSKYKINDKIPITLILDGKLENLYVRYLGIEEVSDRSDRLYMCYKFSPYLPKNALFSGGEEMTVWVTNDKLRVPIVVEASIWIGSVKAVFLGGKNLKYPLVYKSAE